MSNLYFSGEYKEKIINLLIKNKEVVKLINPDLSNPDLDLNDVLIGGEWIINGQRVSEQGHIFDYNFVDDTITQTKVFIFVETVVDSIKQSTFTDFGLYICIFAHKSLIRLSSQTTPTKNEMKKGGYCGNRIDCLCDAVDRMLNGNSSFGLGKVVPTSRNHMEPYQPSKNFYGKVLQYKVTNYNPGGDNCENR